MYAKRLEKLYSVFSLFETRTEVYQKDIVKLIGISQPSVVRELQQLEKDKRIKARHEDSKGKGPGCDVWSLTFQGLFFMLKHVNNLADVEAIANTYPDKLLIFKKWHLFKQAEIDLGILEVLKMVVRNFDTGYLNPDLKYLKPLKDQKVQVLEIDWNNEKEIAEAIDRAILLKMISLHIAESQILMSICKHDPELNLFLDKCLKIEIAEKESEFKTLGAIKEEWVKV